MVIRIMMKRVKMIINSKSLPSIKAISKDHYIDKTIHEESRDHKNLIDPTMA